MPVIMRLISELRRRNVLRMALLYAVVAWLIMQVVGVVMDLATLPDWIGKTTLGLLAVGFPVALVFSWFYEITPAGIGLEKDIDRAESLARVPSRRLDVIVFSLLCAAVILFAYDKWWIGVPPEKSIAVLPFVNMSDDSSNEYFSDGMSEELLNLLARIPNLRVISRSSTFSFKGKDIDVREIAEQLDVTHVLEGSVRKAGDRVRVTAQLIEAPSDSHLWSETYDRDLIDVFAVQDEISAAIVAELLDELAPAFDASPQASRVTTTEAHDAYLRGRYLVAQRTQESVEGAIREFEKAITLDPDYALAHAELGMAFMLGYTDMAEEEANALGAIHSERAMALDPTLAETHAIAGWVDWYPVGNPRPDHLEDALNHFENAVQINPNYSDAYNWMGNILEFRLGNYRESFEMREMAVRLNPLSLPAMRNYIWSLLDRSRFPEADREIDKYNSVAQASNAWIRTPRFLRAVGSANIALAILDEWRIHPRSVTGPERLESALAFMDLDEEALALSEQPDPRTMRILGKSADIVTEELATLDENPGSPQIDRNAGLVLASAGDYVGARAPLESAWQHYGHRVTSVFPADAAAALAVIRRSGGEKQSVDEIIAAIRDDVRRQREAGINEICRPDKCTAYEEGLTSYLSGNYAHGLSLIGKAVEDGYFILPNEAYLQTLYDDPDFAPILAVQKDRQERERGKFLAIVCSDNPYTAVWHPEDVTCERFATDSGN